MPASTVSLVGQRILLVEDNYFAAMHLADELKDQGAQVIGPVASIDEALHLIENTSRIDSAALDIVLRGKMVFPVADILVQQDVPFLFVTGYNRIAIPAHHMGAICFMKPVELAEIIKALAQIASKADWVQSRRR